VLSPSLLTAGLNYIENYSLQVVNSQLGTSTFTAGEEIINVGAPAIFTGISGKDAMITIQETGLFTTSFYNVSLPLHNGSKVLVDDYWIHLLSFSTDKNQVRLKITLPA
jgi:hypothetical protein